ncbi:hypothetical protein DDB_G0283951 [Dictyostelium discoideum AX4]|uniref:Probable glycerol-3-phosphate dehydrogenase, mitochondrial n=1 Tax=Dictyostelium discoideum TaxID=44689 RepID=GPDM_DICDI|nr:hypothetical protein DDB_G0283951 [Dictyostelium discoideum AX4]Q54QC1.1 RecName: Full=Probable glycerol-3-phosphate dehydrogenase, mitochondrial; Short=GPD-M; Short=GPDH-M; Flags: Precursor [Dictyostelium discoideum]EAL65463.1 hypothetical protein DDB_G0283951 [Dictyostelium discoideum AX4]|eukprot:XP_638823.1 hypothetical protein DDB_G0283951 [Dictyostelium discoideum AX4]
MNQLLSKSFKPLVVAGVAVIGISAFSGNRAYDEYRKERESISKKMINDLNENKITMFDYFQECKTLGRDEQLSKLNKLSKVYNKQKLNEQENQEELIDLDLIVIGGGATGTGVALDAQSRGMKVALFEKYDFSSGTSSKSTKLVHGGIRYLESAIMKLKPSELTLVKEALRERSNLLNNAPHLSRQLPIVIPAYSIFDASKFWIGCKLYDFFYPFNDIPKSYLQTSAQTYKEFPFLREGLVSSVVYYDGQHNDSRMNVSLALTAAQQGALTLNYTEVVELIKDDKINNNNKQQQLKGVVIRDRLTGKKYSVPAKCVVNATGPYCDSIRNLDDPRADPIITASSGVHIMLPGNLIPSDKGFLNPKTKDGRVLFILPFEGKTLVGTTDDPSPIIENPQPLEKDVEFILDSIKEYSNPNVKLDKSQVLACWSGIRPLVSDEPAAQGDNKKSTSQVTRSHSLRMSESGLITIVGGKWTTYRSMAEATVNLVCSKHDIFTPKGCITKNLPLIGGEKYYNTLNQYLIKNFNLPEDIAEHLAHSYGDQAPFVAKLANENGSNKRLVEGYPYIEAEVTYGVKKEYACTAEDIIGRRTRLSFLDHDKAEIALPKIINIMAPLLKWSNERKKEELKNSQNYLKTMTSK